MDQQRCQAMYGTNVEVLAIIKQEFLERPQHEQMMELMSRLSDVQAVMDTDGEQARQDINIVKMLLSNLHSEAWAAEMAKYEQAAG